MPFSSTKARISPKIFLQIIWKEQQEIKELKQKTTLLFYSEKQLDQAQVGIKSFLIDILVWTTYMNKFISEPKTSMLVAFFARNVHKTQ